MIPWTGLALLVLLSTLLTCLAVRFDHAPGERRVHLFETDEGERSNPFADLSAGAAAATTCRNCGDGLESPSLRYCASCVGAD